MNRINQTYSQYTAYTIHCGVDIGYPFSGKEKDSETGLSYFGARYYESEMLNIWLSVDPMADKYPNMSPYNYCAWNPIKLVDPDGREFDPTMEKYASQVERYCDMQIKNLSRKGSRTDKEKDHLIEFQSTKDEIQKMREDMTTYYSVQSALFEEKCSKGITQYYGCGDVTHKGNPQHWIMVSLNIDGGLSTEDGGLNRKGLQVLAHELKHCYQFYNKESFYIQLTNGEGFSVYNTQDLEMATFQRGATLGSLDRFDLAYYPNLLTGTMNDFIKEYPGCKTIKHK